MYSSNSSDDSCTQSEERSKEIKTCFRDVPGDLPSSKLNRRFALHSRLVATHSSLQGICVVQYPMLPLHRSAKQAEEQIRLHPERAQA